jgi:cytochrome P450
MTAPRKDPLSEPLTADGAPSIDEVDLTEGRLYSNGVPHDVFTALREAGPVHRHREVDVVGSQFEGRIGFWSVVSHAEIELVNRDWETFSAVDGPGLGPARPQWRNHTLVSMDPPGHIRMRRLINAGFTPRMIGKLDRQITDRTNQVLDAVADRGTCEFVSEVAYRLPMHIISDIVGIPDADRPWVFERTETMTRAMDPALGMTVANRRAAEAELFGYAQELSKAKRVHPADDIWTILTQAEIVGDDGRPTALTTSELDLFFVILGLAGSETTRNAISQGLMALCEHPDQMSLLRSDPSLIGTATDEIIRWSSPVLCFGRTATRDVELGGQAISAGERVVLWYPSGNRDSKMFDNPFGFDVLRRQNFHVSFGGGGPHYCLGANLAKKEVQVMINTLLRRFDDIEVVGPPVWAGAGPSTAVGVFVDQLPVRLAPV